MTVRKHICKKFSSIWIYTRPYKNCRRIILPGRNFSSICIKKTTVILALYDHGRYFFFYIEIDAAEYISNSITHFTGFNNFTFINWNFYSKLRGKNRWQLVNCVKTFNYKILHHTEGRKIV